MSVVQLPVCLIPITRLGRRRTGRLVGEPCRGGHDGPWRPGGNAAGPRRRCSRAVDPGIVQDLPHRGTGDWVAEFDELTLHPPVPPGRIGGRDADHELPDRDSRGWPAGMPSAGVVPLAGDQPPVPGQQRRRRYGERLALSDDPSPQDCSGQARSNSRAPQVRGWLSRRVADGVPTIVAWM
jgi:hypothetical protein